jgi:lipopolysaccharide export system permease protein
MGLIGIGLTARRQLRSGLPISIMYGLTIGFTFWVFQSFCLSLGYGEILPPIVAAWAANLIFLCAAVVLVLLAE